MGLISWVVPVCGGVHLPLVYVHASKCECSRALYTWGSISRGPSSFLNRLYWFGVIGLLPLGHCGGGLFLIILIWCSRDLSRNLVPIGGRVQPHFSIGYTGFV